MFHHPDIYLDCFRAPMTLRQKRTQNSQRLVLCTIHCSPKQREFVKLINRKVIDAFLNVICLWGIVMRFTFFVTTKRLFMLYNWQKMHCIPMALSYIFLHFCGFRCPFWNLLAEIVGLTCWLNGMRIAMMILCYCRIRCLHPRRWGRPSLIKNNIQFNQQRQQRRRHIHTISLIWCMVYAICSVYLLTCIHPHLISGAATNRISLVVCWVMPAVVPILLADFSRQPLPGAVALYACFLRMYALLFFRVHHCMCRWQLCQYVRTFA